MARPKAELPTRTEIRALNFLHANGPSTVDEYWKLGGLQKEGRAYTTTMSLLTTMFEKGSVTRTLEKRAYRYKPTLSPAELRAAVVNSVLENLFEGDVDEFKAAVATLKSPKRKSS